MPRWLQIVLETLKLEKPRLFHLGFFLFGLAVAQSIILAMLKGLEIAIFTPAGSDIVLKNHLSSRLKGVFPDLQSIVIERDMFVVMIPIIILVAGVMQAVMTYGFQVSQQRISLMFAKHMRDRLFKALLSLPYYKSSQKSPATWMSIIMNDVLFIQMRLSEILTGVVKGGVLILAGIFVLFFVHWQSAVFLMFVGPVIAFSMGRTGRKIARYADEYQRNLGRLSSAVLQIRNRFEFIRAHHAENEEMKLFSQTNHRYYDAIKKSIMIRSAFAPGLEFVGVAIFALFVFATGKQWISLDRSDLFFFFGATGALLRPLRMFGEQVARGQETLGAMQESLQLLQYEAANTRPVSISVAPVPDLIRFDTIEAGIDRTLVAVHGVSLKAGNAIAVIGPSGAGKSTLIKTIAGLLPPRQWLSNMTSEALAQHVSFVSQEPFLFSGSLRENLAYGLTDQPSDEQLWGALSRVGMDAEWKQMSADLESPVHAVAGNLSGGQLQRLVVARSWLRRKFIYLFDEATAAVDPEREEQLVEDMVAFAHATKTVVMVVTHRLGSLPKFDEIWFLDAGELLLKGTHHELMQDARYCQYLETEQGLSGES